MFTTIKDPTNEKDQRSPIREMPHRSRIDAQDAVTAIREDLGDVARHTRQQAHELAESAETNLKGFTDTIRSNPLRSSAIALGVGFVVGVLFRR